MLADTAPPLSGDLCPTFGNGFVAATICPHQDIESSSGTFLSGYYSGTCPATGSADGTGQNFRATLPTVNLFAAPHNATYVGMALDLQNATVTRRFQLPECALEVAYFAHRSIRHLMVLAVTASAFSPPSVNGGEVPRCVVRPMASSSPLDQQCHRHNNASTTACTSVAEVAETSRQQRTVVAIHADSLPSSFELTTAAPRQVLLTAFATNLEPALATAGSAVLNTVAQQRYQHARATSLPSLEYAHRAAWSELWKSDLSIGGNTSTTAALRSSAYYILSSVRADWAFGSSPGGLPSTSYHG